MNNLGDLGQNSALLNIAAGITSVRDMGNNNEVLSELIAKIESGRLAGPRIIRSGFIEGKSPFSSNNGELVSTQEDTRTLLRLTALKRLPALQLDDPQVLKTIDAMAEKGVAIDPTLAIHEALLRSRNGTISPGVVDFIEHMPVGVQRKARTAWADISSPEDDEAYWAAFDKIIETVTVMHDKGILLVPGTDLGGSLNYHRELELYQLVGMSPAEILKWASYDMAVYLGRDDETGSIEAGKFADFFLVPGDPTTDLKAIKTISMVAKDGTFYFPSEIYPEFGIQPFVPAPEVIQP